MARALAGHRAEEDGSGAETGWCQNRFLPFSPGLVYVLTVSLLATCSTYLPIGKLAVDMLYIIGLGLADERDISARGLEIVRRAERVYLEAYTAVLLVDKEQLV